jgi:hypothetical protein
MLKYLAVLILLSVASTCHAAALWDGYWVVVGNVPEDNTDMATQNGFRLRAAKCGYEVFNDFSVKFGFKPGYQVFLIGAYATKAEAKVVMSKVRSCIPDAYIKKGAYSGE